MNPSHRRSWTLLTVLALALVGLSFPRGSRRQPGKGRFVPYAARRRYQSKRVRTDTDGDGLKDDQEKSGVPANSGVPGALVTTLPDDPDTDGDGICDGDEVKGFAMTLDPDGKSIDLVGVKTNPTNSDTDDDSFSDGAERDAGTHPLNPDDHPEPTPGPTPEPTPTPTPDSTQNAALRLRALLPRRGASTSDIRGR